MPNRFHMYLLRSVIVIIALCTSVVAVIDAYAQGGSPETIRLDAAIDPTQVQVGQAFTIRLSIVGDPSRCDPVVTRRPLDVVLVLDGSPSMDEQLGEGSSGTKLDGAVEAVRVYLENMKPTDRVGIVVFSGTADMTADLGNVDDAGARVNSVYESLARGGGTNIAAGIQLAAEMLTVGSRTEAAPAIVVLTDGQQTAGDADAAAQAAKAVGYRVVAIGLGPSVDEAVLQRLATQTSDYYYAPTSADLAAVYTSVAENTQIFDPARDLKVTYRFDASNFELLPDTIMPSANVNVNEVSWSFDRLEQNPQQMSLKLRARTAGRYEAALSGALTYLACGQVPITVDLNDHFPVEVLSSGTTAEPVCVATPESNKAAATLATCSWPWGWVVGSALALLLAALWALQHRQALRAWQRCGIRPDWCVLLQLPTALWIGVVAGALAQTLVVAICESRSGVIFWRVRADRSTAFYYQSTTPELPAQTIVQSQGGEQCVGCHTVNPETSQIVSVLQGTNGLMQMFDYAGNAGETLPLQGSYPAWSPDGNFVAYSANGEDIYIYNHNTGTTERLQGASQPGMVETMPAWSPDGKQIAFVRSTGVGQQAAVTRPSDILVVSSSGGQPVLVPGASGLGYNYHPAFSPDGKWLAFTRHIEEGTSYGDPHAEIYLVPAVGGSPRRLQANDGPGGQQLEEAGNTWPTWSADGTKLYFSSRRCADQYDLFVAEISADGRSGPAQRLAQLSDDEAYEYNALEVAPEELPLLNRLITLWPWLLPLIGLLGALAWLCTAPLRARSTEPVQVVCAVTPREGLLLPRQRFTVKIELTGAGRCAKRISDRPLDVVLLVDTSVGMEKDFDLGQSCLKAVQDVIPDFVRCIVGPSERVALIKYDEDAEQRQALTNEEKRLQKQIRPLQALGRAYLESGLKTAQQLLAKSARPNSDRVIVLIANAMPEDQHDALQVARRIQGEGTTIVAIGLAEAYRPYLEDLTGDPETVAIVTTRKELRQTLLHWSRALLSPAVVADVTYTHRFDQEKFILLEGTISPPTSMVDTELGHITWRFGEILDKPIRLEYKVRPRLEPPFDGEHFIDKPGEVQYRPCGQGAYRAAGVTPQAHVAIKRVWIPTPVKKPPSMPVFQYEQPPQVWEPDHALFIGIGGAGRWVLTHLKKNLLDAGAGDMPEGVSLIVIDVNEYEVINNQKMPVRFAGVELDGDEVFVLNENLTGRPTPPPPEIAGWFDSAAYQGEPAVLNLSRGTSGQRPIARMGLIQHLQTTAGQDQLHNVLAEQCVKVKRANADGKNTVRVFVVGSLAGGMSGVLADVAVLARRAAESAAGTGGIVRLEAYLVDAMSYSGLPGGHEAVDQRLANSFASIRELTRLQMHPGRFINLKWGQEVSGSVLNGPLFDDFLFFSQERTDDTSLLEYYLYPAIADVITARLDLATGALGPQDYFTAIQRAQMDRQRQERSLAAGSAGSFTIRVPVADILESLQAVWNRELIQAFLTGSPDRKPVWALEAPAGYPANPSDSVGGFMLGSEAQNSAIEAQALAEYLISGDCGLLDEPELRDRLNGQVGERVTAASNLFINATLQILLRQVDSTGTATIGRLLYADQFLEAAAVRLNDLPRTLHGEQASALGQVAHEYAHAANEVRKSVNGLLKALVRIDKNDSPGLLERLQEVEVGAIRRDDELARILCRRYIWGKRSMKPDGSYVDVPFRDQWWTNNFAGKHDVWADYLGWDATETRGIDLAIQTKTGPVRLVADGPGEFQAALMEIAKQLSHDIWRQVDLANVLDADGLLQSTVAGETAARRSIPLCPLGPDAGIAGRRIGFMGIDAVKQRLNGSPFQMSCLETNLAGGPPVGVMPLQLMGTDPTALVVLQLQPVIRVDRLPGYSAAKAAYDRRDGFDDRYLRFEKALDLPRAAMRAESEARRLERERQDWVTGDPPRPDLLHSYVVAGLQEPDRAELFCLALGAGLILPDSRQQVLLHEPGMKPIVLCGETRPMIDPAVDAFLIWCLEPQQNWASVRQRIRNYFNNTMTNTEKQTLLEGVRTSTLVASQRHEPADRASLRRLALALTGSWVANGEWRWPDAD
jgi:Tol biopolymer transport system component/Mg-chelatase subunit ChlD